MRSTPMLALHEPYAYLYLGDYFADTLDLSADEHRALRLLLLETWVRGPIGNVRLPAIAGLTKEDWQVIKPSVFTEVGDVAGLPLLPPTGRRLRGSVARCRQASSARCR